MSRRALTLFVVRWRLRPRSAPRFRIPTSCQAHDPHDQSITCMRSPWPAAARRSVRRAARLPWFVHCTRRQADLGPQALQTGTIEAPRFRSFLAVQGLRDACNCSPRLLEPPCARASFGRSRQQRHRRAEQAHLLRALRTLIGKSVTCSEFPRRHTGSLELTLSCKLIRIPARSSRPH